MAEAGITIRGIPEVSKALIALPKEIATQLYFYALEAAIKQIFAPLLQNTPEQPANESGGLFDDPGSLRAALDYAVKLDSQGRGGWAGVGFGKQSAVALLVEYGHQLLTHSGKHIGSVIPYPFNRQVFDSGAPEAAIAAFAQVIEDRLPGISLP